VIFDALLLEIILLMALAVGLGVWQRDAATTGRLTFCAVCLAGAAITLGELLLLRGVASEYLADRIKYAGVLALPPLWLGFAAHVARTDLARRIPWFPLLLSVPGLLCYGMMWSGRLGSLFVTTVEAGPDLYGPLWWAWTLYGQALALAGSLLLASTALRARRNPLQASRLLLACVSLLPVVGNALYVGALFDWPYDPTPLMLGAVLVVMRGAVFEGSLLEPLPVSQRELIHQLPLGLILTDRRGQVVEISDTAGNRLGVSETFALGRPLDEVLGWSEPTPVHPLDLNRRGSPAGQLVLLD
jgi:PAS domain-containing protein